jgi:Mrp family chromosome partitioning ATPase
VDAGESGSFDLVPGTRVRNVARALTSPEMSRLVEEADDPKVTVIVLTPPVFAYADALALVDRVDGVLVVCDPRGVHRSQLARLRELITGAGGTVLGTVMHRGQRGRTGQEQKSKQRGATEGSADEPAAGHRSVDPSWSAADHYRDDRGRGAEEADLGDGSTTMALRVVVPPDRS